MIPLKVWPNTALGCKHQSVCMPQVRPSCSAALIPNVLAGWMKARVSPVQYAVIKPHSVLAPTQDSNPGARFKIMSGDHYTTHAHNCCQTYGTCRLPNVLLISPSGAIFAPKKHRDIAHSADYRCAENIPVNRQHTHAKKVHHRRHWPILLCNFIHCLKTVTMLVNLNFVNIFLNIFEYYFEQLRIYVYWKQTMSPKQCS